MARATKIGTARRSERAAELLDGLRDIAHMIETGAKPPGAVVRTYDIPDPSAYTPAMVRAVRDRFGVAQSFFAKMVGVSTILVGSWEQGKRTPNAMAARMLDAMAADPAAWLTMTKVKVPGPAALVRGKRDHGVLPSPFGSVQNESGSEDGRSARAPTATVTMPSGFGETRRKAVAGSGLSAGKRK